jgi:alcohol dehydrogenase (NADP+)
VRPDAFTHVRVTPVPRATHDMSNPSTNTATLNESGSVAAHGYAAMSAKTPLVPFTFERREPGPTDVAIDIQFCGICHSDIHQARDEWGGSIFPMVPGHEIAGVVTAVGDKVTKYKVGDRVGVGCLVDSDRTCPRCKAGLENFSEWQGPRLDRSRNRSNRP